MNKLDAVTHHDSVTNEMCTSHGANALESRFPKVRFRWPNLDLDLNVPPRSMTPSHLHDVHAHSRRALKILPYLDALSRRTRRLTHSHKYRALQHSSRGRIHA